MNETTYNASIIRTNNGHVTFNIAGPAGIERHSVKDYVYDQDGQPALSVDDMAAECGYRVVGPKTVAPYGLDLTVAPA